MSKVISTVDAQHHAGATAAAHTGRSTALAPRCHPLPYFQRGCCKLSYRYYRQVPERLLTIKISYSTGFKGFQCEVAVQSCCGMRTVYCLMLQLPSMPAQQQGWAPPPLPAALPRFYLEFYGGLATMWLPRRAAPALQVSKRFFAALNERSATPPYALLYFPSTWICPPFPLCS